MSGGSDDRTPDADTYALKTQRSAEVVAPVLDYEPPKPRSYSPRIALIGAGGIASAHLDAYRSAGFDVVAICNRTLSKAEALKSEFCPAAVATDRYEDLLADESIDVFDITPHPTERLELVERALKSGKHVLSQKPFVVDLADGERLVTLARTNGVKLAINQNGRWAPHLSYMREAVRSGLIGEVTACHIAIHWDHSWIGGTPFEEIDDIIFFDFGIHWFDFVASIVGDRAKSVYATKTMAAGQTIRPPLLSEALVRLEGGQASLIFDAATKFGPQDSTYIAGTKGSVSSTGPDLGQQQVTLVTEAGRATPELAGTWFNDGFRGAMGELLCAVEDDREPMNSAAANLESLAMTFAAIRSANEEAEVKIGDARNYG
ncbi:Gfo/Idh/MocA family protein [Hoeflea prorocentri]|uniref:Gfo/Idh/MocA family oxidoreductase n=1 Tax=Hoeflea prorocentri TaxID=1922333 RepID=A0A9X3ZHG0_9HYPH|nr:Gfo/Idh/MocA family oxidoreductase [Hoeflea prorocentri]MCY6381777.1 Gfo/Idh/MocA family oxidoreductase [Hoeflea prorocentri]MDA5399577.1 Gfo/Idh/MocA family oxidoreductase [Hoeflea prorocentri]